MRTRREARYVRLRGSGFCRFEARPLSKVPPKTCPYLARMIGNRKRMATLSRKQGKTLRQFEASIRELYKASGWTKKNRVGKTVADPWKMLREHEDKYKARYPQYESPWKKRWKNWRDFQKKAERTLQKQLGQ